MLETVTALATVVSLLSDYASGKRNGDVLELREFVEWLSSHGHSELKSLIQQNHLTSTSIKASLSEGRELLMQRLNNIDKALAVLVQGQGSVAGIAVSIYPNSVFSEQAKEILVAMETCEVESAIEHFGRGGVELLFLKSRSGNGYTPSDRRFYDADLRTLCGWGFLIQSSNKKSERVFKPTRAGSEFAKALISAS